MGELEAEILDDERPEPFQVLGRPPHELPVVVDPGAP